MVWQVQRTQGQTMNLRILRTLLRGLVPLTRTPDDLAELTRQLDAAEAGEPVELPPGSTDKETTADASRKAAEARPRVEPRKVLKGPRAWFGKPRP